METFKVRPLDENRRCRWVYDTDHETRGSYAYETEAETKAAEDEEIAKLASGEWVALGILLEERAEHCPHPDCDGWHETDSCWGIVIDGSDEELDEYARWSYAA